MQEHQVINKYRDICYSGGLLGQPAHLTLDFTDLVDILIFEKFRAMLFHSKCFVISRF